MVRDSTNPERDMILISKCGDHRLFAGWMSSRLSSLVLVARARTNTNHTTKNEMCQLPSPVAIHQVASILARKFVYREHAPVLIQVFKDCEYNSL